MDTIINSSFNINNMLWEIIHCRLLHPSESVMKEMCHHQNLTEIPKHFPKNINEAPCTVHFTEKWTISPKSATVDTTNLKTVEIIHIDFALYNVT